MSNNKQKMKLYTEEQILKAFKDGFITAINEGSLYYINKYADVLTPIELPSDEEILIPFPTKEDENFRDGKEIINWMIGWEKGYKEALQAIRNKIQGGKTNEQQ